MSTSINCQIIVDASGVKAIGAGFIGWKTIPLSIIEAARACTDIRPIQHYGGWGFRPASDGDSQGLMTAAGAAVVIQRAQEKASVITVDDADRCAATINTLIKLSQRSPPLDQSYLSTSEC